tara:strand:+ start:1195 stop:1305 length:111 start_codon:yes stop_codon:yes gene_type:complete
LDVIEIMNAMIRPTGKKNVRMINEDNMSNWRFNEEL